MKAPKCAQLLRYVRWSQAGRDPCSGTVRCLVLSICVGGFLPWRLPAVGRQWLTLAMAGHVHLRSKPRRQSQRLPDAEIAVKWARLAPVPKLPAEHQAD